MSAGEEKAWKMLSELSPADVCKNADVILDEVSGFYVLKSFGMDFHVFPQDKKITSEAPQSALLLTRLSYFFRLSVPWYLISAKEIALTGKLVKSTNLKGGQLFFRGTHVLPLDKLAGKYGHDKCGFMGKGMTLGGEAADYGDASFRFYPLPRMPVILILWTADDEFPPRVDILFDSTCELHLPLDIIWSVAMMSVLIML